VGADNVDLKPALVRSDAAQGAKIFCASQCRIR
jgi:hypothetical protein